MHLGKAMIISNSQGVSDYVQDGVNSLLVPVGDPTALAARIRELWNDPAVRSPGRRRPGVCRRELRRGAGRQPLAAGLARLWLASVAPPRPVANARTCKDAYRTSPPARVRSF